ncbi:MAG: transcriptional repressor [Candidatus Vogelbacteria bacterium]|nr:transcriptional repressor [Candidatus Vogelbacteria bacterium]
MHESSHILKGLKDQGHKFTKVRKLVLDLLIKSPKPLSSPDIQKAFLARKMPVNKTTIYRELAFLKGQGVIRELQFGDNTMRYEVTPDNHHHHIVCINCDKIEDVILEKDLDMEEKAIAQIKNFKILNHSLEFYGICERCQ